jgi:hypothetical protein
MEIRKRVIEVLGGCNSAKGKWPDAFGIPSEPQAKAWFDKNGYKRYRAFMGWTDFVKIGIGGSPTDIFYKHLDFSGGFFQEWASGKNLRTAINDSARIHGEANWSELQKLKVGGYDQLSWQDAAP